MGLDGPDMPGWVDFRTVAMLEDEEVVGHPMICHHWPQWSPMIGRSISIITSCSPTQGFRRTDHSSWESFFNDHCYCHYRFCDKRSIWFWIRSSHEVTFSAPSSSYAHISYSEIEPKEAHFYSKSSLLKGEMEGKPNKGKQGDRRSWNGGQMKVVGWGWDKYGTQWWEIKEGTLIRKPKQGN